jgi:hypothetical protein
MSKFVAVSSIMLVMMTTQSIAQPGTLGIGVVVGAPTGLSVKHWSSPQYAIQGALGGGFGGITVGADFIFHTNALNKPNVPFYYGPGVFFGSAGFGGPKYSRGDLAFGGRFIVGVDYLFPEQPFDLALELGPALLLTPVVGLGFELGVAFRFYPASL